MIPKEKAFSNIESIYLRVLTTPSQFFNDTLCEFYNEIQEHGLQEALDTLAVKEKDRDILPLRQVEAKLIEELRSVNHHIEEYYQRSNLKLPEGYMCPPDISEFRAYNENILISRSPSENGSISLESSQINALVWAVSGSLSLLMHDQVPHEDIWALMTKLTLVNGEVTADKRVIQLRDFSFHGMQYAYREIKEFIAANQIINSNLKITLEQFCEYQSKEDVYREQAMHILLIRAYQILLSGAIYSSHHIEFVQRFALLDNSGNLLTLKLGPTIAAWQAEKDDLERRKKSTFWHAWEEFKKFCCHYLNHSRNKTAAKNAGNYLLEQDLHNEFQLVAQPEQHQRYVELIFLKIRKESQKYSPINSPETVSATTLISNFSFDSITGNLLVANHTIRFPKEIASKGLVRSILGLLTKYHDKGTQQWSWDEIWEEINGGLPKSPKAKKKAKRALYDAYCYIRDRASKQTNNQIKPFLSFNMTACSFIQNLKN